MGKSCLLPRLGRHARLHRAPEKRLALLLEILIALGLTATLLTFLFSFLSQSIRVEKRLEKTREEILLRASLQMRLSSLFGSGFSPLYIEEKSLMIPFEHPIDPDPHFSGAVLGRIHLDEKGNLSLAISSLEKEKKLPLRKEVLFPDVSRFEFEFLSKKGEKMIEWKKEPTSFSMIRLYLERKNGEPLRFAFHLPTLEPLTTYMEGFSP